MDRELTALETRLTRLGTEVEGLTRAIDRQAKEIAGFQRLVAGTLARSAARDRADAGSERQPAQVAR
ncbi:hypothetical protein DSD19_16360 [Rhodovulum sp. BSW8]|uniref:Uncharacterized protein n=1 Tax=Rhodovulum visakhapatnamense TaxID=364297 RepID=A0A4R8FWS1_9RHOB|nr:MULTISPECIES: hypothetical protein [Rhodovulum]OLS45729.1 hypothetical protein BV509_16160 [Rhodovulum sulfidophilum]MBL3568653.1 hypothetical protein [Rhodovulum visakhapatnamense]MBL3577117.1 hypothetical protein [Rhodovulum visakhapatnamense]RBO52068.1 hypothetical protein DSD19_16360 [Rhodovulum sp. BSW8]TDX27071.1 hypothetical protein EV657_11562 [Rhodovulum visakhapatnamense]